MSADDTTVYDRMYKSDDLTYEHPTTSPYYPMFCKAVEHVQQRGISNLLEVGCGSGVLAEMVIGTGISYRGLDTSPVGIEKARKRNPRGRFFVGDATSGASYAAPYDGILCCEVLEHIDGDLDAIALWRSGTQVVCSVPNFDYSTHVRFFKSEAAVRDRYGKLLDIATIELIPKPIFAHVTVNQYLGSVRYAARKRNWKRVLGFLGVNKFAWHGGWFLFSGERR